MYIYASICNICIYCKTTNICCYLCLRFCNKSNICATKVCDFIAVKM